MNTLLTSFEGRSFRPHGILPAFEIKLARKAVSVEVEVIDASLDYNLLLGRSWTYAMSSIASAILWVVVFPHEGKLVIVDQLSFTQKGHMETNESTIPLVDQVKPVSLELRGSNVFIANGYIQYPNPNKLLRFY